MAGPRNLIRKRQDKLLDYELIEEKSHLSFEEQAIANTYKTINTLLLTELPQFNGKALQLLWATLEAFSCLQRDLAADMEQLATSFTHQVLSTEAAETLRFRENQGNVSWFYRESEYTAVAKIIRTLVFSLPKKYLKSVISIFCWSVSVGNISLHFQTLI